MKLDRRGFMYTLLGAIPAVAASRELLSRPSEVIPADKPDAHIALLKHGEEIAGSARKAIVDEGVFRSEWSAEDIDKIIRLHCPGKPLKVYTVRHNLGNTISGDVALANPTVLYNGDSLKVELEIAIE